MKLRNCLHGFLLILLASCSVGPKPDLSKYDPALIRSLPKYVYKMINMPNQGLGTGFAVKTYQGIYIITNAHVCTGNIGIPGALAIENQRQQTSLYAKIELIDQDNDLCFLGAPYYYTEQGIKTYLEVPAIPVVFGMDDSGDRLLGSTYITAGHARGGPLVFQTFVDMGTEDLQLIREDPYCELLATAHNHKNDALLDKCFINYTDMVLSEACIPGQSGSPILNDKGQLVGVVQATDFDKDRCYAVQVNHVIDDLKLLSAGVLAQ